MEKFWENFSIFFDIFLTNRKFSQKKISIRNLYKSNNLISCHINLPHLILFEISLEKNNHFLIVLNAINNYYSNYKIYISFIVKPFKFKNTKKIIKTITLTEYCRRIWEISSAYCLRRILPPNLVLTISRKF
jgi:hypothetical protein